jgi:hypothetical protein
LEGGHIDDASILKYNIRSNPSDQIILSHFHSLISLIANSQLDDAVSTPTITSSGLLYHIVQEQQATAADESPESFDIASSNFAVRSAEYLHLADVVRYRIAHVMDYLATTESNPLITAGLPSQVYRQKNFLFYERGADTHVN